MPVIGTIHQQPSDREDYDIDFTDWFPADDPIASASVSHTPATTPDLYVTHAINAPLDLVKVWISAGKSDTTYKVTVSAQTAGGRSKEVELKVKIKDD